MRSATVFPLEFDETCWRVGKCDKKMNKIISSNFEKVTVVISNDCGRFRLINRSVNICQHWIRAFKVNVCMQTAHMLFTATGGTNGGQLP